MIVDSTNVIDQSIGADRRVPQYSDTQVTIPPTIIPVVSVMSIDQFFSWPYTQPAVLETSALINLPGQFQGASTATQSFISQVCHAGRWRIVGMLAVIFDHVNPPTTSDHCSLTITPAGGTPCRLISRYAAIGGFTDTCDVDILCQSNFTVIFRTATTLAAQTLQLTGSVSLQRIL